MRPVANCDVLGAPAAHNGARLMNHATTTRGALAGYAPSMAGQVHQLAFETRTAGNRQNVTGSQRG